MLLSLGWELTLSLLRVVSLGTEGGEEESGMATGNLGAMLPVPLKESKKLVPSGGLN